MIAGSAGVVEMVGATSDDVNPIAFPISHIGGAAMLAASLVTGMRLVLFDEFDPVTTPRAIAAHHPTLLGTATPFFVAYLAAQRAHGAERLFPKLRACLAGARRSPRTRTTSARDAFGARRGQFLGLDGVPGGHFPGIRR